MDMQMTPVDTRKEKRNAILITIAVVVVAACVIGLVVYNNLADSGYFLRREVAAQSENFTVNGSMMTYFFFSNYNQYSSMFSQMGVDTSYSLKAQYADEQNGQKQSLAEFFQDPFHLQEYRQVRMMQEV